MFSLQQIANYCLACQQQFSDKNHWDFSEANAEWLVRVVRHKALEIEAALIVEITDDGFVFRAEDWNTGDLYFKSPLHKLSQLKELLDDWESQNPPITISDKIAA